MQLFFPLRQIIGKKSPLTLNFFSRSSFLFFTTSDSFGSLHRAKMDGTDHKIIESYKIFYPSSLRLDLANEQIYWLDKYMGYIERVDYSGHHRWSLKASIGNSMRPMHTITLFESHIYITKRGHRDIWRISRRNSSSVKRMFAADEQPIEMRIFHAQTQPKAFNPCESATGAPICEHLCVPTVAFDGSLQEKCICSVGYQLESQTKCTLVKQSTFLLYAKQTPAMIRGISIANETLGNATLECMVPILNVKWPLSMDYSVKDQVVFFGQSKM